MSIPSPSNIKEIMDVMQNGSPIILQAMGRIIGLGPEEQKAFGDPNRNIPIWFWFTLGLGIGIIGGSRIQKKWPQFLPKVISGS